VNQFTLLFLVLLGLTTALKLWLARRHAAHVIANRDRVPQQFAEKIPLASHQKAADYTYAKVNLNSLGILLDVIVLLAFTLGGGINWLDGFWRERLGEGLMSGMTIIASVVAIGALIDLPFSLYRTFNLEARFGFNKMTLKLFLSDLLKQGLLAAAIGLPIILAALWMMDRLGEHWWLYAWLAWSAFNLFLLAVYPTWIAPLFNKFTPLDNAELKGRIERLLQKCGFQSSGLFVMDGSLRSSHGNAYFTGFGKNKRVVFFDTLLNSLTGNEIEAVLAHELGHFKRRHVIKRIVLTFVGSFVFLWLLAQLMNAPWFFSGLGVERSGTALALILFFLALPVFTYLLHPLMSYYSRKQEFEADQYAAQQADARDLVSALVKLYKDNASTLTPDPWHSAFYDSHPPAAARIERLLAVA
jgi:STE24 endopeptidase